MTNFLYLLLLICLLEIPEWLGRLFPVLPIPQLGYHFPLFAPIAVGAWVTNTAMHRESGNLRFRVSDLDLLVLTALLVWVLVEVARVMTRSGDLNFWFSAEFAWVYFGFRALRSFGESAQDRQTILRSFVVLTLLVAGAQLLLELPLADSFQWEVPWINLSELRDNNALSYVAVFALALVLFERPALFSPWTSVLCVIPATIVLSIMEGSRGALITIALLLAVYFAHQVSMRESRRAAIVAAVVVFASIMDHQDILIKQIQPTLTGLQLDYVSWGDGVGVLGGDAASTFTRYQTILTGFEKWLESPIFGIGMEELRRIRVLGLGVHSNWPIPLFAYGVVGAVPYIIFWGYLAGEGALRRGIGAVGYVLCLLSMLWFTIHFRWWFAFALYAILAGPRHERDALAARC